LELINVLRFEECSIMTSKKEDLKEFGRRIKLTRENAGLTQKQLADALKKSVDTVSNYEQGLRSPRLIELPELARQLNVPIDYLFADDPQNETGLLIQQMIALPSDSQEVASSPPSDYKRFTALYVLFYQIFNAKDFESAVKMVPDYHK